MDIHNDQPAQVYGDHITQNSDTPTSQKLSGCAGHSHGNHLCAWCKIIDLDINKTSGYDLNGQSDALSVSEILCAANSTAVEIKSDYLLLRHAFASRDTSDARKSDILKNYGMRWSALNTIPGWLPRTKSPVDFMHNVFLGTLNKYVIGRD